MASNISENTKRIPVQFHQINDTSYKDVWDFQTLLHNSIKGLKSKNKELTPEERPLNHLIFCQHKPVFTLGKSADSSNMLASSESLDQQGFEVFKINRGGDITYHGPGQVTGYFICDLELLYRDVHRYVRNLEEAIILTLAHYGIVGERVDEYTGVWVQVGDRMDKVCAIGVHLSRWVSMHGFGFNINTDLSHFNHIVPCGIQEDDKRVTSLAKLAGQAIDIDILQSVLKSKMSEVFSLDILN